MCPGPGPPPPAPCEGHDTRLPLHAYNFITTHTQVYEPDPAPEKDLYADHDFTAADSVAQV